MILAIAFMFLAVAGVAAANACHPKTTEEVLQKHGLSGFAIGMVLAAVMAIVAWGAA